MRLETDIQPPGAPGSALCPRAVSRPKSASPARDGRYAAPPPWISLGLSLCHRAKEATIRATPEPAMAMAKATFRPAI